MDRDLVVQPTLTRASPLCPHERLTTAPAAGVTTAKIPLCQQGSGGPEPGCTGQYVSQARAWVLDTTYTAHCLLSNKMIKREKRHQVLSVHSENSLFLGMKEEFRWQPCLL